MSGLVVAYYGDPLPPKGRYVVEYRTPSWQEWRQERERWARTHNLRQATRRARRAERFMRSYRWEYRVVDTGAKP